MEGSSTESARRRLVRSTAGVQGRRGGGGGGGEGGGVGLGFCFFFGGIFLFVSFCFTHIKPPLKDTKHPPHFLVPGQREGVG